MIQVREGRQGLGTLTQCCWEGRATTLEKDSFDSYKVKCDPPVLPGGLTRDLFQERRYLPNVQGDLRVIIRRSLVQTEDLGAGQDVRRSRRQMSLLGGGGEAGYDGGEPPYTQRPGRGSGVWC